MARILLMAGPQNYLERDKRIGASRTLAKPLKYSDLIDSVQELLSE
jgi:hypothetical protein